MNKLMLLWLSALFGCAGKPDMVLYKATCGEETLTLRAIDPGALQNHRLYTELTLGNRPAIRPRDRFLPHMLPYDTGIYGQLPYKLIDTRLGYNQHKEFRNPRDRVMLYLDPKKYSKEDFDAIARCVSTHADAMVRAMDIRELGQNYQFAGVVLGNDTDFTQRFMNDQAFIDIFPDGSIQYEPNQAHPPGEGPAFYNFLGNKVQMPGRRIIIQNPVPAVKADWHGFLNREGQPFDTVFSIEYESNQSTKNQP